MLTKCEKTAHTVKKVWQKTRAMKRMSREVKVDEHELAKVVRLMAARIVLARWLPLDVARIWACNWLEHVLSPKSLLPIRKFPPSGYLSLPLTSLLDVAREYGGLSTSPEFIPDGAVDDACAVCLERPCNVAAEVCWHELCLKCALDLCTVIKAYDVPGLAGAIPCPLCRSGIASFRKADDDLACACAHCKKCSGDDHCEASGGGGGLEEKNSVSSCRSPGCRSYGGDGVDAEAALALYCAPFTASAILS